MAQQGDENTATQDEVLRFPSEDHVDKEDAIRAQTVIDAKRASDNEQNMTLMQGIRLYPKAVAWSLLISTCIAMEGYDIALVNNFYAFDVFNHVSQHHPFAFRSNKGQTGLTRRYRNTASSPPTAPTKSQPPGKQA